MRSNQKMNSKEIPLDWDDRPYEAEQKQQIKIRSLTPDRFWGDDTYRMIGDLTDYTVILYLPYECDERNMEYHAKELLNRNCRDIARCSVQNDGWRSAIEKQYADIYGEVDDKIRIWTVEAVEDIEDTLWICKDKVLVICDNAEVIAQFCKYMRASISRFEEMEKQMGMTWGVWWLFHDKMMAWHSECDWWGDPFMKLDAAAHRFIDYHENEWMQYILESRQKELDSKHKKVKVIGAYHTECYNFLICESFPNGIVKQYLHTGYEAYMDLDGEHNHGFMVYRNNPKAIFDEIRSRESVLDDFTLVSLHTREDLSDIKCVYFIQDEERLFENQKDNCRQGG